MVKSHAGRGVLLSSNLPQLQNLIKRDPVAYKEEFLQQWNRYKSILSILQTNLLGEQSEEFRDMVTFISQVSPCYPKETSGFPAELSNLLLNAYGELNADTKRSLISNLIILRKKGVIAPVDLLKTLFPLLPRTSSSTLRSFIRKNILLVIKSANVQRVNLKLNRAVQATLFRMVEQGSDMNPVFDKGKRPIRAGDLSHHAGNDALWAVFLTKDLWKKGIWSDAKSVAIVSLGCFHPITKVQTAALHFFLDEEPEDESSEDDEEPDIKTLQHRRNINKKTRSGDKKLEKSIKTAKKKAKSKRNEPFKANLVALQLLQDPQTFAERLFDMLSRFDKRYTLDHKVLIMQVTCRAMGTHRLCVLPFYTYLLKYLSASQLRVPAILASLATSVHALTPPDVLTPVLKKIAHEFVHPGVGSEVVATGLNAIREVCTRQPLAMEEDLLGDLVEYKKSKDKGVIAAARGLLHLYRQEIPSMLKRRERGKEASMKGAAVKTVVFGQEPRPNAAVIEGLDLLEDHIRKLKDADGDGSDEDEDDDGKDWTAWEVASDSDSSSSSDGWIDVSSDSEHGLEISDSEDEKNEAKGEDRENKKDKEDGSENDNGDEGEDGVSDSKEQDEGGKDKAPRASAEPSQSIAATKILTPADFALLNDLRSKAAAENDDKSSKKRKHSTVKPSTAEGEGAVVLGEADILGPRKKAKATYEERMASIQQGREGREKYGSMKGKKRKDVPSSTTNREKKRNKPVMMVMASREVRGKKKASLMEKQKRMRKHNENQKKKRK